MNLEDALKQRTKAFAVRVVNMFRKLPAAYEARALGRQVLRSSTSVAANYRATCRARSRRDFVSKLGIVLEEIDESVLWLELLVDAAIVTNRRMSPLLAEGNELLRIFSAAGATARANIRNRRKSGNQQIRKSGNG